MKLSAEVLAEFIDIFREAITEMADVSDRMRSLDLYVNKDGLVDLSPDWVKSNRRILND